MADLIAWLRGVLDEAEENIHHLEQDYYNGPWPFMLADIEAKRAILDLHHPEDTDYIDGDGDDNTSTDCAECGHWGGVPNTWPCRTVRLLASAYRDRPGYRDEWRP